METPVLDTDLGGPNYQSVSPLQAALYLTICIRRPSSESEHQERITFQELLYQSFHQGRHNMITFKESVYDSSSPEELTQDSRVLHYGIGRLKFLFFFFLERN